MAIDPKKLKDFQKDLEDKTTMTKDWINVQKISGGIDFRVLDPLPNMNGLYFLEVPVWWINGQKITSPTVFGDTDIIKEIIDEAKSQEDPELMKLIKAVGANGPKLQMKTEYWIPGLLFNWKIEGDDIVGIYDEKGNPDVNLIDKYIVDQKAKILVCGPQLMKAINHEATVRGGYEMFDREKGFNLYIEKTGTQRTTSYKASKMDYLPMPKKYYGEGNVPDLLLLCKAGIYTDEYMESVICNYLYGEELLEKNDNSYRYPEAKEALKEERSEKPKKSTSTKAKEPDNEDEITESTSNEESKPVRPGTSRQGRLLRGTVETRSGTSVRNSTRRNRRNLAEDLKEVDDD